MGRSTPTSPRKSRLREGLSTGRRSSGSRRSEWLGSGAWEAQRSCWREDREVPGTGVGHCDLRAAIPHPRPGPEAQHPLRWQCSPGQLSSALPSESLFSLSGACQSGDSATKAFAVDFSMDVAPSPGSLPNGTRLFRQVPEPFILFTCHLDTWFPMPPLYQAVWAAATRAPLPSWSSSGTSDTALRAHSPEGREPLGGEPSCRNFPNLSFLP